MERFEGKFAVVTGGSSGIGRATVDRFLAEKAAGVAIIASRQAGIDKALGEINDERAIGVRCDITDAASVKEAFAEIFSKFPRVDILVNCAGAAFDCPFVDMTEEQFNKALELNLMGTFRCCKEVVNGMIENGWGRIVNFSSCSQYGNPNQTNYSASKGAILGFSRSLAAELAPHGVTVNIVMPGMVNTEVMATLPPELIEMISQSNPVRRIGKPEELAGTVAFLASDDGGYCVGETIICSGGSPMK